MEENKLIEIGYIYSLGDGLVRYDGEKHADFQDPSILMYKFTIIKPINSITRDVKAWDKYRVRGWEIDKHENCLYFKYGIFKLLKYEPVLTVLHSSRLRNI